MKFDEFLQHASQLEGLVWRKYRRPPARRAVEERMREVGITGYDAYLELLRREPAELAGLADRMHITVTRFFRDLDCWRTLTEKVLPELQSQKVAGAPLRAWSAGCCAGEEPYTLAMIWLDGEPRGVPSGGMEITASDIDQASLDRMRHACYDKPALREVPPELLQRFFAREKGRFCLAEAVTSAVRAERLNIMTDPLPHGMDLVLCRYLVFTYYRGARARLAAQRLWEALRPGGVLMIGKKEELAGEACDFFSPLDGESSFFRRRG